MKINCENFRPIYNKMLVKQVTQKESENIIIPDQAKQRSSVGKIIRMGHGDVVNEHGQYIPTEMKEGDHVMFREFAGTPILLEENGEKTEFLIMRMDQCYGVFKE